MRAVQPAWSQDLLPIYRASRLWLHGYNPYASYSPNQWESISGEPRLPELPVYTGPSTPYPPTALVLASIVSWLPWDAAKLAWLILKLPLAIFIPLAVWRLCGDAAADRLPPTFVLLWFSSQSLRVEIANGQTATMALAALAGAFLLIGRGRHSMAGLLLAVSTIKFQLLPIFLILLLVKRLFVPLAFMAAASLVLLLVFFIRIETAPGEVLRSYWEEWTFWTAGPGVGLLRELGATDIRQLLAAIVPSQTAAAALDGTLAASGFAYVAALAWRSRAVSRFDLAACSLYVLWSMYNGIYSAILLIFPVAVLLREYSEALPGGGKQLSLTILLILSAGWIGHANHPEKVLTPAVAAAFAHWFDLAFRLTIFSAFLAVTARQVRRAKPL